MFARLLLLVFLALTWSPAVFADDELFTDNAKSVAVVVGIKDYRQTVPVDYAHNDAHAMRDYLVDVLGFREENVFLLLDGTQSELIQMFGSRERPQSGRLWRSVVEGQSNAFVYYSGHGVPDLASGEPFLLPTDGDPNITESGYPLATLYRNLEAVKQKVGPDREVIVMIDACFTGETGRVGESLLAVSAPGFAPAQPKADAGLVKLVATSGTAPANWDETSELGLFTSRFLMGAAGLAKPASAEASEALSWETLRSYLENAVPAEALRETGRQQDPEIDTAAIALPLAPPVEAVAEAVAVRRDAMAWELAKTDPAALERYIAECAAICAHREEALALLTRQGRADDAAEDRASWERLSATGDYEAYLESCNAVCAYRPIAEAYLGVSDPSRDPVVARCDTLAASNGDPDVPEGVEGRTFSELDGFAAVDACSAAARAHPDLARLHYQLGRGYDKLGRFAEAAEAYRTAIDAGSVAAINNLGALTENGEGVAPSPPEAFALYLRAAEAGNVLAMTNVARMLEYGRGTEQDMAEAVAWYQRAAEAGDAFSITKLVPHYLNGGPGIEKDPMKGFGLFRKAIDKGDPMAMATVAVLIDNGFGQFFEGLEAKEMVMRALEQGEAGSAAVAGTAMGADTLQPETIRAVQSELSEKRYYTGAVDGAFNPVFIRALDSYARSVKSQPKDG